MPRLADHVALRRPDLRSVNLESDLGRTLPLRAYAPPAAALQLLEEVAESLVFGPHLRAWSVIGPYGAGKSTFAHLLAAVFGPAGPAQKAARAAIRTADDALARRLLATSRTLGAKEGAVIAAATARPEPLASALARGLHLGLSRYWEGRPGRKPTFLRQVESLATADDRVSADDLMDVFARVLSKTPVVILLDEFGKVLEYSAQHHAAADLYLAQQVAELLSNDPDPRGFVVTMQHLSFDDYARTLPEASRREWRKVEGRFGRAIFSASSAHAVQLVAQAIDSQMPDTEATEIARRFGAATERLGAELDSQVALGTEETFPLDPLTVPVAAALAGQLGQHDRSLAAFLASGAAHSVAWHLQQDTEDLGFVLPHDAYAYFVDSASLSDLASGGERYREIHSRIVEASHLPELEFKLLRAIGALNLTTSGIGIKASRGALVASYVDVAGYGEDEVADALDSLVTRGLITFRRFADEYRVWEGSDFEINSRMREHAERLAASEDAPSRLQRLAETVATPRPRVARRHSYEQRTLRYFGAKYAQAAELPSLTTPPGADGLIALLLDTSPAELPAETADGRPLVVLVPADLETAADRALELSAAISVLDGSPELARDPVARREMEHRLAHEQRSFVRSMEAAFHPGAAGVRVVVEGQDEEETSDLIALERTLSEVFDDVFSLSTPINSEMLNRDDLTSQGAKARRELMLAMFEAEGAAHLGLEGHGPERAMFESILEATGIYRDRDAGLTFGGPPADSPFEPLWSELNTWLDQAAPDALSIADLYARLTRPPFGMKLGPIPVLLAAVLLTRREDVMVYQDGSYIPRLGAEHLERLVKTPDRFSVKRFPSDGVSTALFASLSNQVGSAVVSDERIRNRGALEVIAPLISVARGLSEHARRTQRVSGTARSVREALLTTREPDELLFIRLPEACGVPAISDATSQDEAESFASVLGEAVRELTGAQAGLRVHCQDVLTASFETGRGTLRPDLARRSRGIEKHVIEPKMRSFVLLAQDESLDDDDWLDGMAMNLVDKPPTTWLDSDITIFEAAARERGRWFSRLEVLFHEQSEASGATRLTLTTAEGAEASLLLDLSEEPSAADGILEEATRSLGHDAERLILSALAYRLLKRDESSPGRKAS